MCVICHKLIERHSYQSNQILIIVLFLNFFQDWVQHHHIKVQRLCAVLLTLHKVCYCTVQKVLGLSVFICLNWRSKEYFPHWELRKFLSPVVFPADDVSENMSETSSDYLSSNLKTAFSSKNAPYPHYCFQSFSSTHMLRSRTVHAWNLRPAVYSLSGSLKCCGKKCRVLSGAIWSMSKLILICNRADKIRSKQKNCCTMPPAVLVLVIYD